MTAGPFFVPDWPAPANVRALSTVRSGGHSRGPYAAADGQGGMNCALHVGDEPSDVQRNRALLPVAEIRWLNQVHGVAAANAAAVPDGATADASFTTMPGLACAILTADCLPVLFCDRAGRVVGGAHAGWRGLAGGVLENTVRAMRAAGAQELLAWLGPAIGPQAFEVGEDVRQAFLQQDAGTAAAFVPRDGMAGKYFADLYALARRRLAALGGIEASGGGFCTASDAQRFYSYRRDGVTGRMASLAWLES